MRRESDFTRPSPFCPSPERWTAIDGESTEREVTELVGSLVRAVQPDYVVETGTAFGYTAQAIGEALRRNGHGRLVTIELNEARVMEAEERCAQLPVKVIRLHSLEFVPEEPIQFAWLDSGSLDRDQELRRFLPWMAAGTILAVHDTGPQHPVQSRLQPLVDAGFVRSVRLRTPRGVSILEVLADGVKSVR
ncbi:MAG: class I SAM-dependent methyltransferase [Thermaerobacter sp.]|nr:class I SAM-dependent methyltransferase [Thermaerobacter sp.]